MPLKPAEADRVIEARRMSGPAPNGSAGEFTYTVLMAPATGDSDRPDLTTGDRRRGARQRTRLRSGKIVDGTGRFVTECLVHDLSPRGGRLRLPSGADVPRAIRIYDDQTGLLHRATVLWRRDNDVGVALEPPTDDPRGRIIAEGLRRKFYAVRD